MSRLGRVLAFIFVIAVAITAALWRTMIWMPGTSHRGVLPPITSAQQSTAKRLEADVGKLAGEIGFRNVWEPERFERAALHIEQAFAAAGLQSRRETYEAQRSEASNIEATLAGRSAEKEIVVIGAHYDAVRGTVGANDNASGVAALLELSRRLARTHPERTLRFVAFANEEPPFFNIGEMGSQHYAAAAQVRGERIVAMLSLETIGYYDDARGSQRYPFPFSWIYPDTGNFIAFVGNLGSRALLRDCVARFRRAVPFPSEGVAAPAFIPGVAWSDHAAFWDQGYPALMITDTAPFRYPWYHQDEDRPERLDYARMARVIDGLEAVVRELAGTPARE